MLVRVHAAGLDQGVWHLMAGMPYMVRLMGFGVRAPKTPVRGTEVAGVVEAVGRNVTRFAPGDEVFGIGDGTFAEYTLRARGEARAQAGQRDVRAGGRRRRSRARRRCRRCATRAGCAQASACW